MVPGFIIIGAMRCGTTSFYENLVKHPQISPTRQKELHFFDYDDLYTRGFDWYLSNFPSITARLRGIRLTGEATPAYLYLTYVPERIAATRLPDIKFIVLLRDPVERALSHYHHMVRLGRETRPFDHAVRHDIGCWQHTADDTLDHTFAYFRRGLYAEQLEHWWRYFSRERFLILHSEDYYHDPVRVLQTTATDFLGLAAWTPPAYEFSGQNTYQSMNPDLRAQLVDLYQPPNEALYALLDRDFGWGDS